MEFLISSILAFSILLPSFFAAISKSKDMILVWRIVAVFFGLPYLCLISYVVWYYSGYIFSIFSGILCLFILYHVQTIIRVLLRIAKKIIYPLIRYIKVLIKKDF